jgi:hypothetical protein
MESAGCGDVRWESTGTGTLRYLFKCVNVNSKSRTSTLPYRVPYGTVHYRKSSVSRSVSNPDPDWVRIQSGQWIRIRIRNPDPDPGGQK